MSSHSYILTRLTLSRFLELPPRYPPKLVTLHLPLSIHPTHTLTNSNLYDKPPLVHPIALPYLTFPSILNPILRLHFSQSHML